MKYAIIVTKQVSRPDGYGGSSMENDIKIHEFDTPELAVEWLKGQEGRYDNQYAKFRAIKFEELAIEKTITFKVK